MGTHDPDGYSSKEVPPALPYFGKAQTKMERRVPNQLHLLNHLLHLQVNVLTYVQSAWINWANGSHCWRREWLPRISTMSCKKRFWVTFLLCRQMWSHPSRTVLANLRCHYEFEAIIQKTIVLSVTKENWSMIIEYLLIWYWCLLSCLFCTAFFTSIDTM